MGQPLNGGVSALPLRPEESYVIVSAAPVDRELARMVQARLEQRGIGTLLAVEEMDEHTARENQELVDGIIDELERATHLVIVTSNAAHLEHDWPVFLCDHFVRNLVNGKRRGRAILLYSGDPPPLESLHDCYRNMMPVMNTPGNLERCIRGECEPARQPLGRYALFVLAGAVAIAAIIVAALLLSHGGGTADGPVSPSAPLSPSIVGTRAPTGAEAIAFTSVPPLGSSGQVEGRVEHSQVDGNKVLVYIRVDGRWWGPKPGWANPDIPIRGDGTWRCTIFTGGDDYEATDVVAFLVPAGTVAPSALGSAFLPYELNSAPYASYQRR